MGSSPNPRPSVRAWRNVELGERLRGGARNRVYRATRNGADLVVRVSRRTDASLAWELDLLDALAAEGVAVPRTIDTDDGRRHDDGVLVQEFIPGRAPRNGADWRRVVEVLKRVHDATRGWPGRPGFASARTLLEADRGDDVDLTAMPKAAAQLVRNAWAPVVEAPECVIHGDPGSGNVLISGDRVALIDWDEARVDVPAFDFADLPDDAPLPKSLGDRESVVKAGIAWEVATCWNAEPAYARRKLAELQSFPS